MAQRPSGSPARRAKAAPVKKPFPVGLVAGWTVLGLLLGGILAYAATHQGAGYKTPLKTADASFGSGLIKDDGLSRQHRPGHINYSKLPPDGGNHNGQWESCQVYSLPIPNEHAVHSLEHGAVWVTYRPDLPAAQVQTLVTEVKDDPFRMLSPFPGLKSAVSLQAWGRQYFASSVTDPKIAKFLSLYTHGPQAPEQTNSCRGGVTVTGNVPQDQTAVTPTLPPTVAPAPLTTRPGGAQPTPAASHS
ncbi:MAG: DUF3105 domain-containing protein [Actinomycetota bacterium]|nr:DUF3105 domain-containing protein [Actinomycetota bacterium]